MMRMNALVTIVDRSKSGRVQQLYREQHIPVSLILKGHGTANSQMMELLGLDEPEKELLLTLAPVSQGERLFAALASQLHLQRPGTGIAFACSLSGISMALSSRLSIGEGERKKEEDSMEEHKGENPMELIVTIVDMGGTDVVVQAARKAGAHGGTVVKAREMEEEQKKIFGMTLQPEKEIVLMVVPQQVKKQVFQEVCAAVLEATGAHAVMLALPVCDTVGLKG